MINWSTNKQLMDLKRHIRNNIDQTRLNIPDVKKILAATPQYDLDILAPNICLRGNLVFPECT